jgi:hypothetical protein
VFAGFVAFVPKWTFALLGAQFSGTVVAVHEAAASLMMGAAFTVGGTRVAPGRRADTAITLAVAAATIMAVLYLPSWLRGDLSEVHNAACAVAGAVAGAVAENRRCA